MLGTEGVIRIATHVNQHLRVKSFSQQKDACDQLYVVLNLLTVHTIEVLVSVLSRKHNLPSGDDVVADGLLGTQGHGWILYV